MLYLIVDMCLIEFVANYDTKVNKRHIKGKIIY